MSVKPKTVRRLLVAGAVAVVVVGLGAGFIILGSRHTGRALQEYRRLGLEAAARHEYPEVLTHLSKYLRRYENDPEVLLAYARARAAIPEPDGSQREQAIAYYVRYRGLRPDDRGAAMEFLDLCLEDGRYPEAKGIADSLLPAKLESCVEADVPVLRRAARAAGSMTPPDATLPRILERGVALAPLDVDLALPYVDALQRAGKKDESARFAEALAKAHPDDPRARLTRAFGTIDLSSDEQAASLAPVLCALAGLDANEPRRVSAATYPDEPYALRLAATLESLGRHEHAALALEDAARQLKTPTLVEQAIRRSWQSGDPNRVVALTDAVGVGESPDAMAFRALALRQLGRGGEVEPLIQALATHPWDYRAKAWIEAIPSAYPSGAKEIPGALVRLRAAAKQSPTEPAIAYLLGEALAMGGHLDEALKQFEVAGSARLSSSWAAPWIRVSQVALRTGRFQRALQAADTAVQRAPRNAIANISRFSARLSQLPTRQTSPGEAQRLLRFAEAAMKAVEGAPDRQAARDWMDVLAAGRVRLLLHLSRRDEAVAAILAEVDRDPPASRVLLEQLAVVSMDASLGIEPRVLEGIERAHGRGATSDRIRAEVLRRAGDVDGALTLLRDGVERAPEDARESWQRELASFLDVIGDPGAARAWIDLADAHPDDVVLQRRALSSRSAAQDAAFVTRAASRVAKTSGEGEGADATVQLARARVLLGGQPGSRQRAEAVGLLREVVTMRPADLEARLLLVDALLMSDPARGIRPETDEAISQLREAASASADRPWLVLRLVLLLQERQDFDRARNELRTLAREYPDDAGVQGRVAQLLVRQGDADAAVPVLRAMVAKQGDAVDPGVLALLGTTLAGQKQHEEARGVLARAAAHPALPLDLVPQVASGLARLGDESGAGRLASRLEGAPAPRRAYLLARYADLCGKQAEAVTRYREAMEASPENDDAVAGYAEALMRGGNAAEAGRVVDAALKRSGSSPALRVLALRIAILAGDASPKALKDLADALAKDPASAPEAELLRAVGQARERGDFENPDALQALAARFPGNLPLQTLVVRQLMSLHPPEFQGAAKVASRAMLSFPTVAEPARLATAIYAGSSQWNQAISSAKAWRDREPAAAVDADLATAQALLGLSQPERAASVLRAHVAGWKNAPEEPRSLGGMLVHAQALVAAGKADATSSEYLEVAKRSRTFRNQVWLRVASTMLKDEAAANAWIDAVKGSMDESDPDDRVALASCHVELARRFEGNREANARAAATFLRPITGAPDAPIPVMELEARALALAGAPGEAVAVLRRALARDPASRSTIVLFAEVLLARPEFDPEALRLAESAHAMSGGEDPGIVEVYADALERSARAPGTTAEERASRLSKAVTLRQWLCRMDPSDLGRQVALAHAADLAGDFETCVAVYQRVLIRSGLDPKTRAAAQNNLACAYLRGKKGFSDLARAESASREALRLDPRPSYWSTLGQVLSAMDQRADALKAYRTALQGDPGHPEASIGVAILLASGTQAERAEALELLKKIRGGGDRTLAPAEASELARLERLLSDGAQVDANK